MIDWHFVLTFCVAFGIYETIRFFVLKFHEYKYLRSYYSTFKDILRDVGYQLLRYRRL